MDIQSRRNPKIRAIRRLQRSAKARRTEGRFVAEGVRLAEEALRAGWLPEWVLVSPSVSPRGQAVAAGFRERGVTVFTASEDALAAASATETPQGILLVLPIQQLPWPQHADFLLVLDGIRDPGNLGTILRTAWAAGVQGVLLTPTSADPYNPKVVRAGMGAHFRLPMRRLPWDGIRKRLARHQVFLTEANQGTAYTQVNMRQPLALVIGGEADGLSPEARSLPHEAIHIPMPGQAESLNAAVAAGVMLFEVVRQRGEGKKP